MISVNAKLSLHTCQHIRLWIYNTECQNYMKQNNFWEANIRSAIQKEILRLLRNPKVHYRVDKTRSHSLDPIPSQMNQVHSLHPVSSSTLILSSQLHEGLPSALLPARFPTKQRFAFVISCMRATRSLHLNLFDLVIVMGGKALWTYSPCNSLQLPPFWFNFCPSHPILNYPQFIYLLLQGTRLHTHRYR